ncbi:MAG TPA: hypothetical protein VK646_08655 [Actinomycetota bacterium]|nr:hypothetical protein [Actinomycetota bacterium]
MGAVAGFLPSTSGFRFPNAFPHVPVRRIGIPGMISVPIGDASNGLCGGMVFAARDYFEAERTPPADTTPPADGPLFDFLVDRLFDSFCLPWGPARYLELMSPALPDGETFMSRLGIGPHGRSWQIVADEWPKVRADIDGGHPSPLGLATVKSSDPFDLKQDHQVLAYGYDLDGSAVTLHLYDPNQPARDDVVLRFDVSDPTRVQTLAVTPGGPPVVAFFRVTYRAAPPP